MTIKELKDIIKELPDDMKVGGSGHFGEYLECWDITTTTVTTTVSKGRFGYIKEQILCVSIESAGDVPD